MLYSCLDLSSYPSAYKMPYAAEVCTTKCVRRIAEIATSAALTSVYIYQALKRYRVTCDFGSTDRAHWMST
jgi:hypothetical protein